MALMLYGVLHQFVKQLKTESHENTENIDVVAGSPHIYSV
jgi:hypothetical protein